MPRLFKDKSSPSSTRVWYVHHSFEVMKTSSRRIPDVTASFKPCPTSFSFPYSHAPFSCQQSMSNSSLEKCRSSYTINMPNLGFDYSMLDGRQYLALLRFPRTLISPSVSILAFTEIQAHDYQPQSRNGGSSIQSKRLSHRLRHSSLI